MDSLERGIVDGWNSPIGTHCLSGRITGLGALILVMALFVGCRTVPIELAAPEVDRLNAPIARVKELEAGRALYTSRQKCARCHRPKTVTEFTAAEWTDKILPRMAKKAKLTDLERQYVLQYILTARSLGNQETASR